MASQALYRKWRSQTFDEIIGQQHVTQTLLNALRLDRVAHAYLFAGPRGTGKTSTARLLAKAVNCQAADVESRPCNNCEICAAVTEGRLMDLIEIDAASNTGVDDIRDLREKVGFRPAQARIKFYIIDEVHMLSNSAFNALLKTLEEPPPHVIFVLATTEPERIPATITSRCQRFDFKRIKLEDVVGRLAFIVEQEGFKAEPAALEYIARQGGGSMRDAISLLDQMVAYGGEAISLELVQTVLGAVASKSVTELADALIARDSAAGLDVINRVVNDGVDPRHFAREIVEYLRYVLLVKLSQNTDMLNLPEDTLVTMRAQADALDTGLLVQATTRFNEALVDIKSGMLAIPQLPLELAFVESVTAPAPAVLAAPAPVVASVGMPQAPHLPAARAKSVPAATPPSAPAPPQMTNTSAGPVSVDAVRASFGRAIDDLEAGRTKDGRKGTMIANALRYDTRLLKVEQDTIYFVTSKLMKDKFEKPQPQATLDDVFSRALGQPVRLKFLLESDAVAIGGPTTADADAGLEENTQALLKVATEELGGVVKNGE
ncbi:MAG: DNA polymerase III subunit gamma/tau [Chloroflexi bacterium]|nr:MAG: DNA polymerase III subunit gamma/tau [Chloroflexota bacterium]